MMDEVYEALKAEYYHQEVTGFCTAVVDGMSGFVFRNQFGGPLRQGTINRAIKHEAVRALQEGKDIFN